MDSESDLRDLNALLNNNNNINKETKNSREKEDISYVSYWFSLYLDQLTKMRNYVVNAEGDRQNGHGRSKLQVNNADELDWRMASLG